MEVWFIYALLSSIFAGLYSFFLKISAEKNHDSSLVTTYSMFTSSLIGLIFFLLSIERFRPFMVLILASLGNSIFYFIAVTTRIKSLKNINATIYFPTYKSLSSIIIIFIGVFIFSDKLTYKELIGIILGISVPLLLIHKEENKKQLNLKKGLVYLGIGTIFVVMAASMSKIITINNLNISLYISISFFLGGLLSLFIYKRNNGIKKNSIHRIKRTGILNGIFLFLSVYLFVMSTCGDLSVVYIINSFSIFVPIIMSIIIYKEHFNLQKGFAILMTLISLFFMK